MSAQPSPYTPKQVLQFLGVFAAIALVCLATLFIGGQAPPPPFGTPFNMYIVVFGVGVVLPLALWFDVKVRRIRILFYTLMHVLSALTVMFYLGPYNPMVALWLMLCIITYMEFGMVSFYLSSVTLLGTAMLFCLWISPLVDSAFGIAEYTFYSFIYSIALIVTAYVITRVIDSSDKRRREL